MASEWHTEFRLSITRALGDQLADALEPLQPAPLTLANLADVRPRPGVYLLYLDGERVYVGKANTSLSDRLGQHLRKVSGRSGLAHRDIRFVCVYVDEDLDAAAPEKLLIKKYRKYASIPWNTNGFGNKDPGRNRDGSMVGKAHFDALYPIDLEYSIELTPQVGDAGRLLDDAKPKLPYLLRFDSTPVAKKIYRDTRLVPPPGLIPVRKLIAYVVGTLPLGWQATALPGYVVLYRETRDYESAVAWWRRGPDGTVEETPGPRHFAEGTVESEDAQEDDTADVSPFESRS